VLLKKNPVVSFSGPDGSGKSTQIELLRAELERRGTRPVVLWMRLGYTPGFDRAKSLVRKALGRKLPKPGASPQRERMMGRSSIRRAWLAAAIADLLFTSAVRVRLEAWRGRSVICDRYVWDSLVDRKMYFPDDAWVDSIVEPFFALVGKKPSAAVLLALPFEEALRRSEAKDEPFPDTRERRAARHAEYEALARGTRFTVVDATRTPDEIAAEIASLV